MFYYFTSTVLKAVVPVNSMICKVNVTENKNTFVTSYSFFSINETLF